MSKWNRGISVRNLRSAAALFLFCLAGPAAFGGSVYSDKQYVPLASDPRADSVGEGLTVLVYEQASSSTTAERDTRKSAGIEGTIKGNSNVNTGGVDVAGEGEGGGTISRTGRLMASVSVTVRDVLPNGELLVSGEQLIEFNEENQHIKIEGRVRPEDISADNTIISTRLADSKITYVGDGLLGQQQKPGIISRFFTWLF